MSLDSSPWTRHLPALVTVRVAGLAGFQVIRRYRELSAFGHDASVLAELGIVRAAVKVVEQKVLVLVATPVQPDRRLVTTDLEHILPKADTFRYYLCDGGA